MSILFSIIRLIPSLLKLRIYAHLSAVLFGLMWTALLIHKIAVCESNPAWKQSAGVQCVLGHGVGAFELASECGLCAHTPIAHKPIRAPGRVQLTSSPTSSSCFSLCGCFGASSFRVGSGFSCS